MKILNWGDHIGIVLQLIANPAQKGLFGIDLVRRALLLAFRSWCLFRVLICNKDRKKGKGLIGVCFVGCWGLDGGRKYGDRSPLGRLHVVFCLFFWAML